MRSVFIIVSLCLILALSAAAIDVKMAISGPGAVNDSTIKAGKEVSFDIYFKNDGNFKAFSLGFLMTSPDIKTVIHPEEDTTGLGENGDVNAFNDWETKLLWSLGGLFVVKRDWDGKLPEQLGFGGISMKKFYEPHDWAKNISVRMTFEETGTFTIDSAFFPPRGDWVFVPPETKPSWGGPYTFTVIK